jgi:hypothetical protein
MNSGFLVYWCDSNVLNRSGSHYDTSPSLKPSLVGLEEVEEL